LMRPEPDIDLDLDLETATQERAGAGSVAVNLRGKKGITVYLTKEQAVVMHLLHSAAL